MSTGQHRDEAEADAAEADPRPVYQGSWEQATGRQRGEHSERVRQWKIRQERKRQSGMGAGSEQQAARLPSAATPNAQTRAVLESIRDDSRALASDRIRAAQALIGLDRGAEAEAVDSDLVQLRAVLEALKPDERLAWLQGERVEALRA